MNETDIIFCPYCSSLDWFYDFYTDKYICLNCLNSWINEEFCDE